MYEPGTGRLEGLFVGPALGRLRTGAIGAVAVDALVPDPRPRAAIVGCGGQALAQARALAAVRRPTVLAYCRSPDRRRAFAAAIAAETGLEVRAASSAEEAVRGADLVILATSSTDPVLDPDWLQPSARLVHVGPKRRGATDLPPSAYGRARRVVTDAPAQLAATWHELALSDTLSLDRVDALADVIDSPDGRPGQVVFCSLGLPGTEVLLARAVLAGLPARPAGPARRSES